MDTRGQGDLLAKGALFSFRGPRRFFIWATAGVAQTLHVDEDLGVAHVRVLAPHDGELRQFIGHVPILLSALRDSRPVVQGTMSVPREFAQQHRAWTRRRLAGEVGAFSVPLSKAVRLTLQTAREAAPDFSTATDSVEHAYPKVGIDGAKYSALEAVLELSPSSETKA